MSDNELRLELLERQVKALRSVLSEYGSEHNGFVQWMYAEALNEVLNSLVYSWHKPEELNGV